MPFFENASNLVMKNCTFTKINADGSKETWTCHEANTDNNASPFIPEAESTSTRNRHPSASDTWDDPFVNPDGPPNLAESFIDNSNPNTVHRRHATRRSRRTAHGNHHCMTTTTTTTIVSMNSNDARTVLVRDSFNSYNGEEPPHMPFRRRSIPQGCRLPSLGEAPEQRAMPEKSTERDKS